MNAGESDRWPTDRPGTSGRGAKAGPATVDQRTGPYEVDFEEVLAWGPDGERVVERRTRRSDLALRLATGLAAAAAVAVVALGASKHTPSPASDTDRVRPATTEQETPELTDPSRPPSCMVDWPNQQHVPCPLSLPKAPESEPACYRPNRVCLPR
jgi:hypothetical protein